MEPLIVALGSDMLDVGTAAAEARGRIADARAVEPLIGALRVEQGRVEAFWGLVAIGSPAVEPLIDALKDEPDCNVRAAAAEALEEIGDPRAAESLIAALEDGDSMVRNRAAKALNAQGWQPDRDSSP